MENTTTTVLVSLLEIRQSNWTITFDEEFDKTVMEKDDIDHLGQFAVTRVTSL